MAPDFTALRRESPPLEHRTYLNSGSYCALANSVKEAFNQYLEDRLLIGANWDVWVTRNEAVRQNMAKILRAIPEEIAVTATGTFARLSISIITMKTLTRSSRQWPGIGRGFVRAAVGSVVHGGTACGIDRARQPQAAGGGAFNGMQNLAG